MKYKLWFGNESFITLSDKESAIRQADCIGRVLLKVNILSEINQMQAEAGDCPEFKNKFTIPDYFINLVLSQYNMKIAMS